MRKGERMGIARTIVAVLVAVAVAMLPVASGAAFKLKSADTTEMSASEPMHDCCPNAGSPCEKAMDDCGSMATCALTCCSYVGDFSSPLVYPLMLADVMPWLPSGALRSQIGNPPFRPPRV